MNTWLTDARAFESLFSASPSAIVALDSQCRIVTVNPAYTLLTGYTQNELVGRDMLEGANAPLRSFLEDAAQAAGAKRTVQRSLSLTLKDDSTIVADVISIPVLDDGQSPYLFLVIQDTSWREHPERRPRAFFDGNPIPAVIYDAHGSMLEVNAALVEQSGYSADHFIGRPIGNLSRPERREGLRAAFEQALLGRISHSQTEIRAASGQWTEFEATFIPRIEGTEIIGVYGLYENVTQERAAEQRLADQTLMLAGVEHDFRTIFEHLPTPIIAFDRNRNIIDVNPATLRLAGRARENVIGHSVDEFILGDPSETADQCRDVFSGKIAHGRARGRGAQGEVLFDVTHAPMYSGSEVCGAFALLENVTALTRTDEDLDQTSAQFRLLFEHNPTVVIAIDTHQRITDINAAGLRVSGYVHDEIAGRNFADFVPPSQRDALRASFSQAVRGETVRFSIDAYAADGRLIQYEATALPIVSQQRIVGVYGLMENVTERIRAERTVAAQREEILDLEHDFRSLFAQNPDGIALLSTEGTIIDANDAALNISKYPREVLLGQDFRNFVQGQQLERVWAFFRRAANGEIVHYDVVTARSDGSALHLEVTLLPKRAQRLVVGIYCIFKDVTARQVVRRKVEMQAQRMRDLYLLATTPEYTDAHVLSTLQTGCRLLGMESGAIVEVLDGPRVDLRYDSLELFAGNDERVLELAQAVVSARESVIASEGWIGSRLILGGTIHGALLFFSRTQRDQPFEEIDLDTLALMAALVGSALERRRTRSHLRTLAYYDSLTGLPNRLSFQEHLRDALVDKRGHGKPLAVLYFDLDRFKDINDTLGHAMGDRLLQIVAHRLVRALGDDGTVARMGGDEFIILVRNCENRGHVRELAAKLLTIIEEPFRIEGYEQFITTSIGVATYPEDGRDDQTLIKNADIAMYRIKDRGGNGYLFYDRAFEAPLRARLTQEKLLRRAIEQEQFVLHYQPIIDVPTGRIVCVEALVRWMDPQRGLVFPDEFIPVAEASGLIMQLGDWVISEAARQIRLWSAFAPLSMAINISARQFHQSNLCDRLNQLVTGAGVDPRVIEIEITESMALADLAQGIETVRQLKRLGATIAVDDFGTGHSSLNYLRRFEVDHLKIDRSFVAGIGTEPSDESIIRAIIAMGHSLGLSIVAEGVETSEQYEFLRAHQCDRVQGYLFSKPLAPETLESLLHDWRGNGVTPG